METEDFKRIGEDLFGNSWQTRMARALGIDGSTVRRWVGATIPVPPAIQAFLAMMGDRQEARGALVFTMQHIGAPAGIPVAAPDVLGRMTKKLKFPGVEQLKPMPAITAPIGGPVTIDDGVLDRIAESGVSYVITRHPDTRHLQGYADAARAEGHDVASIHNRHHHYSILTYAGAADQNVMHVIATHTGTVRIIRSAITTPGEVLSENLMAVPGADASVQDGD